ncbi:MAG: hypothetical protein RI885_1592 [Actinomycetota bacterium]
MSDNEALEDAPLDPAGMLALVEAQQRTVDRTMLAPVPWLYGIWGTAWLVGFLLLWSAWDGGNPWFRVPGVAAGIAFAALIALSIVASAVLGSRINRGVRGGSDFPGLVYGVSWSVCSVAFFGVGAGLAVNGADPALLSVYFPSAYGLMAGTLYLAGAALFSSRSQLVIGIIVLGVSAGAPFAGQPGNNLVMAVAGGGTFLVAAVVAAIRLRSTR